MPDYRRHALPSRSAQHHGAAARPTQETRVDERVEQGRAERGIEAPQALRLLLCQTHAGHLQELGLNPPQQLGDACVSGWRCHRLGPPGHASVDVNRCAHERQPIRRGFASRMEMLACASLDDGLLLPRSAARHRVGPVGDLAFAPILAQRDVGRVTVQCPSRKFGQRGDGSSSAFGGESLPEDSQGRRLSRGGERTEARSRPARGQVRSHGRADTRWPRSPRRRSRGCSRSRRARCAGA